MIYNDNISHCPSSLGSTHVRLQQSARLLRCEGSVAGARRCPPDQCHVPSRAAGFRHLHEGGIWHGEHPEDLRGHRASRLLRDRFQDEQEERSQAQHPHQEVALQGGGLCAYLRVDRAGRQLRVGQIDP